MNRKVLGVGLVAVVLLVAGLVYISSQPQMEKVAAQASPTAVPSSPLPTDVVVTTPTAMPVRTESPSPAVTISANFTVAGKVFDANTGVPLAGFAVFVYQPSAGLCSSLVSGALVPIVSGTASQIDGTYVLRGIAPGAYLIGVAPRGSNAAHYGNWWWNNKTDCQSAEQFVLKSDAANINFAVIPQR